MYILQRRRQFFGGKRTVHITFHGNGGETSTGDITVVIPVLVGTLWINVPVPHFIQHGAAKQQSGFTSVQNDDNTLIVSDYIVTGDMEVWASYTVVETGFITAAGEVISADNWITKYGNNCYDPIGKYIIESMRDNLIMAAYFRSSDGDFGIFPHINRSAMDTIDCRMLQDQIGGGDLDMSVYGIPSEDSRFVKEVPYYEPKKFPFLFIPPDWETRDVPQQAIDRMLSYSNGIDITERYYQACQGYTDNNGITGSPGLEILRSISIGNVIPAGKCYVPTFSQIKTIATNINKLEAEIIKLDAWNTSFGVPAYWYSYYPASGSYSGIGFTWVIQSYSANIDMSSLIQCISGTYDENGNVLTTDYRFGAYNPMFDQIYASGVGSGVAISARFNNYTRIPFVFDASHLF